MARPFDVLVVGELNADLILRGDVTPVFGQVEKLVDDADLTVGSSSAIFACGAARLGLRVAFVGKVGADTFGDYMLQSLRRAGVDTCGIIVDQQVKTGLSVILACQPEAAGEEHASGQPRTRCAHGNDRAILTHPGGSIAHLQLSEVNLGLLYETRHLHYASYYLQTALRPVVPSLFAAAHDAGATISLDTNYDPAGRWNEGLHELLGMVDVFLPNETELSAISGLEHLPEAYDWLAARVPLSAVKLGARGAAAIRGGERWYVDPLPVQVVDTVGAGDSFDAGFIRGYLDERSPLDCLRMANACGALSTRAAGGTAAQATMEEVEKVMKSNS